MTTALLLATFGLLLLAAPQWALSGVPVAVALCAAAVVAGAAAWAGRAAPRFPWLVVSAAYATQGLLLFAETSGVSMFNVPWALVYFLALGLFALSVWAFVSPAALRDVTSLVDTGVVGAATALVLFEFLLRPLTGVSMVLVEPVTVGFSAVILDVFLAAGLVWLWVSLRPVDAAGRLLYAALAASFTANVALQLSSIGQLPNLQVSAFALMLYPVLQLVSTVLLVFAVATARPGAATVSGFSPEVELSTWRLAVVVSLPAIVPPVVLLPYVVRDGVEALPVMPLTFTLLLWALLTVRVVRLLRGFRAALWVNETVQAETVRLLTADDALAESMRVPLLVERLEGPGARPSPLSVRHPRSTAEATLASVAKVAVDRAELSAQLADVQALARSRALLEHTADVIVVVGEHAEVVFATPSSAELLGRQPAAGEDASALFPDRCLEAAFAAARSGSVQRFEAALRDMPGTMVETAVAWVENERVFVVTLHDVTELRQLASRLREQAVTDPLTGLLNRAAFQEALQGAVADGFSLVVFDLDGFKGVNDVFGHLVGDALLVELTGRLVSALPGDARVARLGGDEFAVVLPGRSAVDAQALAEAALVALAEPYELEGGVLHPSASAGVAAGSADLTETFRRADVALYAAKAAGKDTVAVFDEEAAGELTSLLRRALLVQHDEVSDQLKVVYQPLVTVGDGVCPVGFEALVRWEHPSLGLVRPDVFLPLAKEADALAVVSKATIASALRQLCQWRDLPGASSLVMSVNVQPDQLADERFCQWLLSELEVSQLPGSALVVEVLESDLASPQRLPGLRSGVEVLRAAGVRVFLDDFGTGFSSLARLGELNVDGVKTARELWVSPSFKRVLGKLVELVSAVGVSQVVVEGVERWPDPSAPPLPPDVWLQGFAFAPPLSAEEASALLDVGLSRRV